VYVLFFEKNFSKTLTTHIFLFPYLFFSTVDVYAYGLMMIRLFTLKLPYPIEVCTMKQLMDGGRAGVLVPTKVMQSDVPDASVFHIINACLDKNPRERPTFKIIEETLSNALKRCKQVKNQETKSNQYISSDGTMFTHPPVKSSVQ
jgi:serine/threonine protein kinase